jgi:spermidine synthase
MSQFKHVLILPGLRNHYLASDGELTTEVAQAIANRNISTISVNKYYVDDQLLRQRSDVLLRSIDRNTILNSDFTPVAYFRQLQYWLSYFRLEPWVPAALLGILFLVIVGRLNVVSLGMFTGGFAASSIEVILLISFQIIYGYVYQATGFVITIFMAGLAAGSYVGHKRIKSVDYTKYAGIQFALALYSTFLPFILYLVKDSVDNDAIIYGIFSLLTVFVAFPIGIEFSFAARLLKTTISSTASTLYSVDLIGSALGALMVSIYVLPLLGITWSCIIIASLCLASALASFISGRHRVVSLSGGNAYV